MGPLARTELDHLERAIVLDAVDERGWPGDVGNRQLILLALLWGMERGHHDEGLLASHHRRRASRREGATVSDPLDADLAEVPGAGGTQEVAMQRVQILWVVHGLERSGHRLGDHEATEHAITLPPMGVDGAEHVGAGLRDADALEEGQRGRIDHGPEA